MPKEEEEEEEEKASGTRSSQAVSHPGTIRAQRCFTSVIGRVQHGMAVDKEEVADWILLPSGR